MANYGDPHLRTNTTRTWTDAERAADHVTHDVNKAIHKTFITPIDREQIHALINTMDDVADLIQDSAETMALYDVRHATEEITRLTDLASSAASACAMPSSCSTRLPTPPWPRPRSRPAKKSTALNRMPTA